MKSELLKNPLPYFVLFLCHLIWAVNTVIAKITLFQVPVMSLLFIRFLIASLILLPFLLRSQKRLHHIEKKHVPLLVLTGVFMIVFNNALGYSGLSLTTAIDASILGLFIPLISVLFGWWILKEKIYRINLVGILFGFTGAVIIIGLPFIFGNVLTSERVLGNLLIVVSGICVVIGFGLSKELVRIYPPVVITAFSFLIGMVAFFIPAVIDFYKNPQWIAELSQTGVFGILFVSLFATVLAYLLVVWALERINLNKANIFHYIEPGITAVLAIPLLGESLSSSFLIGSAFVILGVYWATLGKGEHHRVYHKPHHI